MLSIILRVKTPLASPLQVQLPALSSPVTVPIFSALLPIQMLNSIPEKLKSQFVENT